MAVGNVAASDTAVSSSISNSKILAYSGIL